MINKYNEGCSQDLPSFLSGFVVAWGEFLSYQNHNLLIQKNKQKGQPLKKMWVLKKHNFYNY